MKTITTRFWTMFSLLVVFTGLLIPPCQAQGENPLVHVSFEDTLIADDSSPFVRNNLNITNIFNRPLTFTIRITTPEGFSLVSQNNVSMELAPGETQILPVTINKLKSAPAKVQLVAIDFDFLNPQSHTAYQFAISAKELFALRIFQIQKEFQITEEQRTVNIGLRIKNIGNVAYDFHVRYFNKYLVIDKIFYTTLNPFSDTVVYFKYVVPQSAVRDLVKENIAVNVGTDTNSVTYNFYLRKLKNSNADHKSPYATFPLTFEFGGLMDNNTPSFFWGVSGAIDFNENNLLSFNYRSKQYGMEGLQADVFNVFYKHKKWDVTIGQMSAFNHFMASGIGAQVAYHKNEEEGIAVSVVSNNLSFSEKGQTGQAAGINSKYKIGSIFWDAAALAYVDPAGINQSYVFQNKFDLINKHDLALDITLGTGLERIGYDSPELPKQLTGLNGGYGFKYGRPKWQFFSSAMIYTDNFPGIYKGWRSVNNELTYYLSEHFSTTAFYNSNYTRQSFFIDSIYYDNQFMFNLTSYGARLNYGSKKLKVTVGGGNSTSSGMQLSNVVPVYRMGMLNLNWIPSKSFRISLNSMVNFNEGYGTDNELVVFYSNFLSLASKYGGINVIYNQMPKLSGNTEGNFVNSYRTTIGLSPYLSANLFRNKLQARVQYSYYRVRDINLMENQYIVGSLAYNNSRMGLSIQGNANYGLKSSYFTPTRFVSLSVRKSLNLPIVTKRRYFDFNLYCFEDLNGNGIKDAGDTSVSNVNIEMNFNRLVSNQYGHARYKNLDTGSYVLDFRNMKNEKGLIPSRGYLQKLQFEGATEMYIPFTQGKIVRGKVNITLDSLSANTFEVDQLRVTATDTMGNKYFTFTDSKGNFQINLPASHYVVSLNPEAFDDVFKPVQMAFNVDLLLNQEMTVNFHVKQKARGIRKIKANIE